ncbi:FHA domain-containing protein [Poriferisphaera sp. WC338]|uniref:FHA domain-containing protein n=1 Tax=Poriferisphaera sp. WC338 TaxID=3425129 RepID=UPI003D813783
MPSRIVVLSGQNMGDWYEINDNPMVFGRDEDLLAEINDCFVSNRHMKIRINPQDQKFYIKDLDSRNGVILNGKRIKNLVAVKDGDLIQIGYTLMVYTCEELDRYRAVELFVARNRRRYIGLIDQLTQRRDHVLRQLNEGTNALNALTIHA